MGLKIKTDKTLPIGVDLGSGGLKMAQLRTSGDSVELLAAGAAELPENCRDDLGRRLGFQSRQIRGFLRSGGFKGRQAVVSVPAADTFVRPVRIPAGPQVHLEEAIRTELHEKLPFPVEEAIVRHVDAGVGYRDGHQVQERIVVAVPRSVLHEYLSMAHRSGLDVVGINVEPCAVVECFARQFRRASDESRVTLFMDIGSTTTQIVLARGARMIFARNLPVGERVLDKAVADSLGISAEQARQVQRSVLLGQMDQAAEEDLFRLLDSTISGIATEITQCIRYYESVFQDRSIERIVFVGGQAHNNRLCRSIAERLNLPAQVGDPLVGVRRGEQVRAVFGLDCRGPQPSWVVAIGLSLGGVPAA